MGVTPLTHFRNQPRLHQLSSVVSGLCGLLGLVNIGVLAEERTQLRTLSQWEFNPQTYQLQFSWEAAIAPRSFMLKNPTRIVIDLPQTELKIAPVNQEYQGLVAEIRIAQFQPETTRLVLELAPEADLKSDAVSLKKIPTAEGNQWQLTPEITEIQFPVTTLLQLPPADLDQVASTQKVQVPSPPPSPSSQPPRPDLSLAAGKEFQLRYRGEKPLTLQVEQPWQEILFLEENLTDHNGDLIAPAQTPVIGHFKTTSEGTRLITQALITTLEPATTSEVQSAIPLKARSALFPDPTPSSPFTEITILPNTVFTVELTEDWHYQR